MRRPDRDGGRFRLASVPALAAVAVLLAASASGSEELPEKPAYVEMLRGDRAREAGDIPAAMAAYQRALTLFERLRRERPNYKTAAIDYRMDYCRTQVADLMKQPGAAAPADSDSAPADRLAALQQSLEQLEHERGKWEQERTALIRERDDAAKTAQRLQREAESVRAQLDGVIEKNRALEADLKANRDTVPLSEVRQVKRALEESESARSALARHVEKLEQQIATLTARLEAATADRQRLEAEMRPSADAAAYAAEIDRQARELGAARSAVARADARAESLAARLARVEEDLTAARAAASADAVRELDAAREEIERLRAETARLRDEVAGAKAPAMSQPDAPAVSAADIAAPYEAEIARQTRELNAARSAAARADARAESLAARLAMTEEQLAAARAAATPAAAPPTAPEISRELEAARRDCDRLRAEAAVLQSKLDKAEAARNDDRARLQELGRALKAASSSDTDVQRLQKEAAQAAADRDAAREQIAALRRANEQLDEARLLAEQKVAELAAREAGGAPNDAVRRLESRLQAAEARLDLREQQLREARDEAHSLRKEMSRDRPSPPSGSAVPVAPATPAPTAGPAATPGAVPSTPPSVDADAIAGILAEASAALASNQVDRALALYERAVQVSPGDPGALMGFLRASLAKGNLRAARAAAERVIDLHPGLADGYHGLGMVEAREGNRRSAVRAFSRAVEIEPERAVLHRDLAIALYKADRIADAIAEYREVVRLAPNDGQSHFNLATMLMMTKDPPIEEARSLYERALALGEPPDAALESKIRP